MPGIGPAQERLIPIPCGLQSHNQQRTTGIEIEHKTPSHTNATAIFTHK
jgi:hypothetical protein